MELCSGHGVFRYDPRTHRFDVLWDGIGFRDCAWGPDTGPGEVRLSRDTLEVDRPPARLHVRLARDGVALAVDGHPRVL
ncbi:MAG TPA: hypothetical protein VGO93_08100, partial [Candidatus Xenobia bacterium]